MVDRHKEKKSVRLPSDEKDRAAELLRAAGWGLTEYVIACLRMLIDADDKQKYLSYVGKWRPPERRGRPKKST